MNGPNGGMRYWLRISRVSGERTSDSLCSSIEQVYAEARKLQMDGKLKRFNKILSCLHLYVVRLPAHTFANDLKRLVDELFELLREVLPDDWNAPVALRHEQLHH